MDVLTDTMSTTQMQSKTGYVDSYDAMVEMERKMSAFKDFSAKGKAEKSLQAAVKAEDDAYDEEDASRRDASYDFYVGYRKGKASQAGYITWKTGVMATTQMQSETRRDAFYNAVATQIAVKVMEASKAAVKAETRRVDSYDDVVEMMEASKAAVKAETRRVDSYDDVVEMMEEFHAAVAFEAEAYDDVEGEGRAAVAFEVRRYIDALEVCNEYLN